MERQNTMLLHHQNFMLAVRREMGWPEFKPANDCICFCSGQPMDLAVGSEMARISQQIRKDAVYTGWSDTTAVVPANFTIVYRELLTVDVVDRLVPFAADEKSPLVFVSIRSDEYFAVDRRGALARIPGKPKNIGRGGKLAMKRIRATAATVGDALLENNRFVPTGADWIEPEVAVDTIVRFN